MLLYSFNISGPNIRISLNSELFPHSAFNRRFPRSQTDDFSSFSSSCRECVHFSSNLEKKPSLRATSYVLPSLTFAPGY